MLLIKISKRGKITNINKPDINFIKNNKHISKLNIWKHNNYDFVIYGCESGNAGEENKYDLPPPIDCELYFDDLYVIKLNNNKLQDLNIEEYNTFYNECFGGFEDIQSSDNEEEEEEEELSEHSSDRDFINDDNISLGSETRELDLEELSSFTSDEDYVDEELSVDDDIGELSSIEITVSSCDEEDDLEEDDLEDDLEDVDTE